jgi:hypothetical protein
VRSCAQVREFAPAYACNESGVLALRGHAHPTHLLIALSVVGAIAAAGTAIAGSSGSDSQVTISPRAVVAVAGQPSPVDVGGVRAVRAGKPIPARYVLSAVT